jgi:CRISPR-associated protein Cas5d
MKVERVTYDIITPGAARNILQAIYWKPEFDWVVDRIHVLNPPAFTNIRRNELKSRLSEAVVKKAMRAVDLPVQTFIEEDRTQRAAVVLRDVDYVIEAHFESKEPGEFNHGKHAEMFRRRASKGQCFNQPYLGTREFSASFELLEGDIPASRVRGERDLGFMLFDIDFANNMTPMFFRPLMRDGIVDVPRPDSPEVYR